MSKLMVGVLAYVVVAAAAGGQALAQYGLQGTYRRLPDVPVVGPAAAEPPVTDQRVHAVERVRPPSQPRPITSSRTLTRSQSQTHATRPETCDAWVTIKAENFEGPFPNEWWLSADPTWGDESYRRHAGSYSGYCVGSSITPPGPYPSLANAWTVFGPFSLAGATDARVDFYRWFKTELDCDYLKWLASVDGSTFFGYKISGDQQTWTAQYFDLKNVPTLGNLCGRPQVWIAFAFTSDAGIEYEGAYIDDVLLQKDTSTGQPDLTYYQPSGWDFPIVPSNVTGTHTVPSPLPAGTTYIDWAGTNAGAAATTDTFFVYLYRDGTPLAGWYCAPPVNPGAWYRAGDYQTTVSAGSHTLMTYQDSTHRVAESNENNNRYSHSWTWVGGGADYDHVTITSSAFASRFAPLSNFLEAHLGLNDTVVAVENIYTAFPGRDNSEKIRNFIKYAYTNWSTTHVLLGGDADVVPCRYAYGYVNSAALLPCDLYYSDLDGDWDANGNSVFGEVADNVDMYPDVYVGRAAASVASSVDLFVQKFLSYSGDSTAAYLKKVVLGGFDLDTLGTRGEVTMDFYDQNYVPTYMKPCNKVYDSQGSDHKALMLSYLNSGQHVWVHTDHGNKAVLGCGDKRHSLYLYPNDLYSLTNGGNLTLFLSIACLIGAFDTSDCIVEDFLRAPNGGGVAAVVNSREGWFQPGINPQRTGSALFIEWYLYGLFSHPTGNASLEDIVLAKAALVPLADTNRTYRWCMYEMNLFGEPAMKVWLPRQVGVSESPDHGVLPEALSVKTRTHFGSSIELRFSLPQEGHVKLSIYDRAGRRVRNLVNSLMRAGYHEVLWDGCWDSGQRTSAGVYYAELETERGRCSGKLIKVGKE